MFIQRPGYHQDRVLISDVPPSSVTLPPFPIPEQSQARRPRGRLTTSDNRANANQFIRSTNMASAGSIESMKIGGTVRTSPAAIGMFPLILLAGIFVLIIFKK